MQSHISQLTRQRLSDFFVREDEHVAHKNALVAGTIATGAIFASLLLTPDTAEAFDCGEPPHNFVPCDDDQNCCSGFHGDGEPFYFCVDGDCP